MTGHPSDGGDVASRRRELSRLRTFCLLNAVLCFCFGVLIPFLRPLGAALVDDTAAPVAGPLLAQEVLCAVSLIVLAAMLLHVRGASSREPAAPGSAVRAGRVARVVAVAVAAVCALGVLAVLLLPIAESAVPTVLVTGFVIWSAFYNYAVLAKLSR